MNRLSWILAALFLLLVVTTVFARSRDEMRYRKFTQEEIQQMAGKRAIIRTDFGEMEIQFYPHVAPNHVANFIDLAQAGFYDGTVFHRVRPGFMIQGGDPNSRIPNRRKHGIGSAGYRLKAEFSEERHVRGTLSMARFAHPDSASSQFFICVGDAPWLDGKYTVFGEIVSGMEVADRIVIQPRDSNDNPLERVEMKIRIIEPEEASEEDVSEEKEVEIEGERDHEDAGGGERGVQETR